MTLRSSSVGLGKISRLVEAAAVRIGTPDSYHRTSDLSPVWSCDGRFFFLRKQPAHLLGLPPPLAPDRHGGCSVGDPVALRASDDHRPGAVKRPFQPVHHLLA